MLVNVQEWGCFSIFRRADDGGGVLVNVQECGNFSIFRRAGDVTRTMSKGGGACECLHPPPPSGNPVSAPALYIVFHPSKFRPPPHTWMAGYGPDISVSNSCEAQS